MIVLLLEDSNSIVYEDIVINKINRLKNKIFNIDLCKFNHAYNQRN